MNEIVTPLWRDAHLHLRQPPLLPFLGPYSARWCSDVLVMPNTTPPILNAEDMVRYRTQCAAALGPNCIPRMTLYLTLDTTPQMIREAKALGLTAIKVYPAEKVDGKIVGMTTNAHHGITREHYLNPPKSMLDVFKACEDEGVVVCWHGELPEEYIMDAESKFCPAFERIARQFPKLRMVMEHVSSRAGVQMVQWLCDDGLPVAGTLTLHHLWLKKGLNDVMRPKCKPDWVFMPIAKSPDDHAALIEAVKCDCFFLGTDSAPHEPHNKYCPEVCAGAFTAPHPEMLLVTFEEYGLMDYLTPFTSARAGVFYGWGEPVGQLKFVREEWIVPPEQGGVVPFLARRVLPWKLLA